MQKILGLVFALLLLCAGCGEASDAQRACAAQQRAQYSDAQWAEMNQVQRAMAGAAAAEACTP
jgi:hypothetical protein